MLTHLQSTTRTRPVRIALASSCFAAGLAMTACVNDEFVFHRIEVEAEADVDPTFDDAGNLHVQAHLATTNPGGGELEHPLGEFERFEVLDGARSWTRSFDVPLHVGEGLVIYMWLDVDGDGVLCAPDAAPEPAGIIEVSEFPTFSTSLRVALDQPCKGAEALYP